jgi:hypothetical protein
MEKEIMVHQRVNSLPTQTGKDVINTLFGTLKLIYPNFLKGQPEAESKRIWMRFLGNYTVEHIQKAIDLLPDRFPSYPPTVGEFKEVLAEINKVAPGQAIEMNPVCPECRAPRNSQRHQDICGENNEQRN